MNLTRINLLTIKETVKVFEPTNEKGKTGSHLEEKTSSVSFDPATGEVEIREADGTGCAISIDQRLVKGVIDWVQSNARSNKERSEAFRKQQEEEHLERMKSLQAQTAEAQLRLEEERLRHDIRMVELRTQLAQRRKELIEAEAEVPAE